MPECWSLKKKKLIKTKDKEEFQACIVALLDDYKKWTMVAKPNQNANSVKKSDQLSPNQNQKPSSAKSVPVQLQQNKN